jgi:hypothetical protein
MCSTSRQILERGKKKESKEGEDDVGLTRHQIACGYQLTSNNMMRDLFGFVQGRRTEDTKAKAI